MCSVNGDGGMHTRLAAALTARDASKARKLLTPGVPRLAVRALARARKRPHRVRTPLFFGGDVEVVLPEFVSEAIYLYGFFDEVVSSLAIRATRPGDVVLDVGAHFGYFSALFSALVGPQGHVYSFEPTPATYDVLSANAGARSNVTAIHAAAGDVAGTSEILAFGLEYAAFNTFAERPRLPDGAAGQGKRVRVPVLRLDDFVRERRLSPAVVKIDAENFEEHVIDGMRETIARHHPRVILEAGSDAALHASRALVAAGYTPHVYLSFDSIVPWQRTIEEANAIGRDILFDVAGGTRR